ncbi:hypothetical protein L3X38_003169 [Prunus dulcis]|uniref:Uncharacterized protein n=1 Tax=Prunus dulcis TaxID=3755 RepID=A0AAD4ZLJ2_PRUDU|nr:hypothetical protein L3X38_003169 [Prunus dulcis]
MPPEFVNDHERHVDIEPVVLAVEDTTGCSLEAGLGLPATVIDTAQTVDKVESISQGVENTLPIPPFGTSCVAADTALHLPTAQPPAPPLLGTFDTTAGISPQLLAVLPPTPSLLGTSDTTAGTSPQLPAMLPRGEIIDDSHKDGDASTSVGAFDQRKTCLGKIVRIPSWHSKPSLMVVLRSFDLSMSFFCFVRDTMELLDIINYRLVCWRDAIYEAITLGFHVDFLLNLVRNLARVVFGAIHSMKLSHGSDEVKAAADALNTKQQQPDHILGLPPFFSSILHSLKVVSSWLADRLSWPVVLFPWRP